MNNQKTHYNRFSAVVFFTMALFCNYSNAQQAVSPQKNEAWADSAYNHYYGTGEIDQEKIDSVMFLFPAEALTEGKEKLYRIMASYYHNMGKPNFAFPYLTEIEKSVRARGDNARLSLILAGLAECQRSFGNYEKAISYGEEAVRLAEQYGEANEKGYAHGRLGAVLFEENNLDSGNILPHLRIAILHYSTLGNTDEEGSYLGDYANVLFASGEIEKALKLLHEAEEKISDSATITHLYNVLSNVYLHSNNPDSAITYASKAYQMATDLHLPIYAFHATSVLQMANDSLGNIKEAYFWSLKNNKLMNIHYADLRGTDVRLTQLEAERKTQEIENNYLRTQKEQDERLNQQNFLITIVSITAAFVLLVIAVVLFLQRKQLIDTQRQLKFQKSETDKKNDELTKFISVRDKLISVASHDLRAPLTTLKNLLEVFSYPDITQEEITEAVIMLEAQYERSIDMADNLLLWVKSQLQGIEPRKLNFDLVTLNLELVEVFKAILTTSKVEVELKGTTNAIVYADKEMVMFVLRNLLHNAIKFSPEGKSVEIEILEFNDFIQWTVKDKGPGISAESIPHLFEMNRAERTADSKRGAGLGLYLSKFFTEQNDGKLSVKSTMGEGAKMILKLPKSGNQVRS